MRRLLIRYLFLALCIFATGLASAQQADPVAIEKNVSFLAADLLQGRKPGTVGCDKAANYIRDAFKSSGLKMLSENGYQYFNVTTDIKAGTANTLHIDGVSYEMGKDYNPFSFAANGSLTAEVVFAGYGFEFETDTVKWHDYQQVDVRGKWVLIMRGNPEPDNENSVFVPYTKERSKVLMAKDKGAAGVLFVTSTLWDKNDELVNLSYDKSKSGSGIPVINIKRSLANQILLKSGKTIEELEANINKLRVSTPVTTTTLVKANVDLQLTSVKTQNVVGLMEGSDPVLKNQVIVVGAHYDHLGMGGPGSGSRKPDTSAVHNGADDNASGVAAVIELARTLYLRKASLKRSVLFVAFSAEEMGLLGSSWFTSHPLTDLNNIDLMINFDMVGRMNTDKPVVAIGGTGTFLGATAMLDTLMKGRDFKAAYSPEGYGPSDHAPFYADSIPVLYFNTGAHSDYHTPEDDADRINYQGIVRVVSLAQDVVLWMESNDKPLAFMEAGPKEKVKHESALKVRLGIMPDFANTDVIGVAVGAVTKGGPAEHGGLLKGDIITALSGKSVANIYEYMDRLKTFNPGQTISVDVKRSGKDLVFLIQL